MAEQRHTPIEVVSPENFPDYELIDCGDFEKLERFGNVVTIRPESQAIWNRTLSESEWRRRANVRYESTGTYSGNWEHIARTPQRWPLNYKRDGLQLTLNLELTKFKHVGVFPEQAVNWDFIYDRLRRMRTPQPRFLNLFAYTGGASLAARAAGADVVHVDAIKQVISWSRTNMESSKLEGIRWVVEDALKFARREQKRGNTYNGIILDPPAFGHGPNGEVWKLEKQIGELVRAVFSILDRDESFLILNTYSLGFSSQLIGNLTRQVTEEQKLDGTHWLGELGLKASTGHLLPLGVLYRFTRNVD